MRIRAYIIALTLVLVVLVACPHDKPDPFTPPPPPPPSPQPAPVASITLAPANPSLVGGESVSMTATLKDASGAVLTGRSIDWSSSQASIASVSSSGLVTGQSVGTTTISASSGSGMGTTFVTVKDGAVIGAPGGQVTGSNNAVSLTIPPNALTSNTSISITPVPNPGPSPPLVQGTGFDFGPAGTQFAQPVTVKVKYNPALLALGVNPTLFRMARLEGSVWTALTGSTVDTSIHVVTGQTSSFSEYAVLETAPVTGTLSIVVNGLPAGIAPQGTITGPGGFSQPLTGNQSIADAAVGSYAVTPSPVSDGTSTYTAAAQNGSVTAGQLTTITVTYSGTLNPVLTIQGGGSASGAVAVDAAGGQPALSCVITNGHAAVSGCGLPYPAGTALRLTASPSSSQFAGWGGGCSGTTNPCQFSLNTSTLVTATFAPLPPIIQPATTTPFRPLGAFDPPSVLQFDVANGGGGGPIVLNTSIPPITYLKGTGWLTGVVPSNGPGNPKIVLTIDPTKLRPIDGVDFKATFPVTASGAVPIQFAVTVKPLINSRPIVANRVIYLHTAPANPLAQLTTSLPILKDGKGTPFAAGEVTPVADANSWFESVTFNTNSEVVLTTRDDLTLPLTPDGLNPGVTIRVSTPTRACPLVNPDPNCQFLVRYTSNPDPEIRFSPWGLTFSPATPGPLETQVLNYNPGFSLANTRLGATDCPSFVIPSVVIGPPDKIHVAVNPTTMGPGQTLKCKINVTADKVGSTSAGTISQRDLEITVIKPAASAVIAGQDNLNLVAVAGGTSQSAFIEFYNFGTTALSAASVGLSPSCLGLTVTKDPTRGAALTDDPLTTYRAQVTLVPGIAALNCAATLSLQASGGAAPVHVQVSVRIK